MLPAELLASGAGLSRDQRRLLTLHRELSARDRESLLAFAEFLLQRSTDAAEEMQPHPQPKAIPRAEGESVVAAMKRLSESYHMIDKDTLLHQSAALMAAHVMQGRPADAVIDELEQLFEQAYQRLIKGSHTEE